jgi:glucosamine--fructose-6-phosphate aminotransferase (isomerizing)
VAATKSFITSLAGIAALVAAWSQDATLTAALPGLPAALDQSFALAWQAAQAGLQEATNLFLISRGYGLSIAQEAALKLKETSGLHGEAFSSAEVRHGPMAIVRDGFPVLGFDIGGQAGADVRQVCADFAERGAQVFLATAEPDAVPTAPGLTLLPALAADEAIAPLLRIASFYRMVNALSLSRGFNPDEPRSWRK